MTDESRNDRSKASAEADIEDLVEEDSDEPDGYCLTLPTFEGPLDLLLHLIRKHEIDIYDIPIVMITEQYNAYLEAMDQLDLEVAADYVYMAALLINIKSRMLLPRHEEGGEEAEDPRKELVDRLIEYQRFKSVAETFAEVDLLRTGVWSRPPVAIPRSEEKEVDFSEVSLFDLIGAFQTALRRYQHDHPHPMELRRTLHRVSDKMKELIDELAEKTPLRLLWYLEGRDRGELVAIFLGMLELVRLGGITLRQGAAFGDILIHRTKRELDIAQFAIYDN